jgi:hypothetical protein
MPVQGMLWTSHWLDVQDGADLSATVTMDGFGPASTSGRLDVSRFGTNDSDSLGAPQFQHVTTRDPKTKVKKTIDLNGSSTFGALENVISVSWNIACFNAFCKATATLYFW